MRTVIIAAGGRHYGMGDTDRDSETIARERKAVADALSEISPSYVIHGACLQRGSASGFDAIVDEWCRRNHCSVERMPAPFKPFGKIAGPARIAGMVAYGAAFVGMLRNGPYSSARLVGLIGPGGSGTSETRRALEAAGIEIVEVVP